ncbi:MAG: class I SAM-dependent methyltransferase, partial [Actinomycetota bacterium]
MPSRDATPSERRNLAVRVSPAALRHVRRGHPWIYDQAIERSSHDGEPGDLAVVFDDKRAFAAIGLWDPTSPIRIRVLANRQTSVGPELWRTRIAEAVERRRPLVDDPDVTGLRWLHGENDRVPGLVVDGYGPTLVVKLYSPAWLPHLDDVVDALVDSLEPERVILRLARSVPATPGRADGDVLLGDRPDASVAFLENGHTMTADPVDGQKTGYFLDQRANRRSFGDLAEGRDVLDVFCCHGGFSVHAAAGGARSVVSTDLSPHATDSARRHVAANAPGVDHRVTTG